MKKKNPRSKCLPCAVHYRTPLKDIVTPLFNELEKELKRIEVSARNDNQYDTWTDKAYDKFHVELSKHRISQTDGQEALHEAIADEGTFDLVIIDGDYFIRNLE